MEHHKEYICYREKETRILEEIDAYWKQKALAMGAVEYHIPAMIDKSVLDRCGYFKSFPHHLSNVAYVAAPSLGSIAGSADVTQERMQISHQYLTPAACLHIYPMLEGEAFSQKIVTTRARVYRYEDGAFNGKTRLWDFTVREIVFAGSREYLKSALAQVQEYALAYLRQWGLQPRLVGATDHFYPGKRNDYLNKMQQADGVKTEIQVDIGGEPVALSSLNLHKTHFSAPFAFDAEGTIETACVGFGLERWVAAILEINGDGVHEA